MVGLRVPQEFSRLPLRERFHVLMRQVTAPLERVVSAVPMGKVADVGCGHGLLTAMLARSPSRSVVSVDPDERKVRWARMALAGRSNVTLAVGRIEDLAVEHEGSFDAVVVCDVLYLLPTAQWLAFLRTARELLRPGGVLVLKEVEADGSWKHGKALAQEWVMVRVLGRTQGSGALALAPRARMTALLEEAGFRVDRVEPLGKGFTTPHVLYVARALVEGAG
jgi:2-polyprenyl-6-hydroxyphenyl methylase/3-demethylubiquinone-9 3-methyltransferase